MLLSLLPLLLSFDVLLANPPMSEENLCRRLNVNPNSLHIFSGLPSFVLFVVEAFVRLMLARVLAVFAFVFHPSFCRHAASMQLAVVFAAPALIVPATSVSALAIFLLFRACLLCAPAGILIH